ncbi:MAG: hypothetical protein ACK4GJ_06205, partial [bacterium]
GVTGNDVLLLRYNDNGTLDNSFGNNGFAIFGDNNNVNDVASAMAIHNNKIYIAGVTGNDVLLLRYNDNGTLDNSFGNNGVATFDYNNRDDNARAIAFDNNYIYLAGYTLGGNSDVLLLRCDFNGNLDISFGNNGFATYHNANEIAYAMAIDNNFVYLAGDIYQNSEYNTLLLRFFK